MSKIREYPYSIHPGKIMYIDAYIGRNTIPVPCIVRTVQEKAVEISVLLGTQTRIWIDKPRLYTFKETQECFTPTFPDKKD